MCEKFLTSSTPPPLLACGHPLPKGRGGRGWATGNAFYGGGGDVAIGNGRRLYFDGTQHDKFLFRNTATGNVEMIINNNPMMIFSDTSAAIPANYEFYLDGGSDTYISQTSNNVMSFTVGVPSGTEQVMQITSSGATITSGNNLTMSNGDKITLSTVTGGFLSTLICDKKPAAVTTTVITNP